MLIIELIFAAAEILFIVYLVRKGKKIAKEMHALRLERQSVMNLKEMLEEDLYRNSRQGKNGY